MRICRCRFMHYLIDGYNMMFRLMGGGDLTRQREALIQALDKKVLLAKIDVAVIFDSALQIGERSQSHYGALTLFFSAEGETADEYILDALAHSANPRRETVVTSDKKLGREARDRLACVETVEAFTLWLDRVYRNRLRNSKKKAPPLLLYPSAPLVPLPDANLATYERYYQTVFESEWKNLLEEEQKRRIPPGENPMGRRPNTRHRPDPFFSPPQPEAQGQTEMERWLKVFERHVSEGDVLT